MVRQFFESALGLSSGLFAWAPGWVPGAIGLTVVAGIAVLLHALVVHVARPLIGHHRVLAQTMITRTLAPSRLLIVMLVVGPIVPVAGFTYATTSVVLHTMLFLFILVLGWSAIISVGLAADVYLRRFRTDVEDNLLARKHVTQVRILSRAADTLIVVLTVGVALMTISAVRQYGVSLFASAGAAGLVVGLAARPLLTNLIAGIQIAVTQPIRIEDAVVVEGEWGWIEEIGSTYVVIRIWDKRRLIIPLSYFIEKPFQNWTHSDASLIGTVHLYVDWTVPVDRLRERLDEAVKASPRWDRKTVILQVTGVMPSGLIELRALVSARNSSLAWDLRCEIREALMTFLRNEYPHALPRTRINVDEAPVENEIDNGRRRMSARHPLEAD